MTYMVKMHRGLVFATSVTVNPGTNSERDTELLGTAQYNLACAVNRQKTPAKIHHQDPVGWETQLSPRGWACRR